MTDFNNYIPELPVKEKKDKSKDTDSLLLQILLTLDKIETHLSIMTEQDLETSEEEHK